MRYREYLRLLKRAERVQEVDENLGGIAAAIVPILMATLMCAMYFAFGTESKRCCCNKRKHS